MPLAAAMAVTALAGAIGAGLDTAHGAPARTLFAVFLALGAGAAAMLVRREHRVAAVVSVPLVYLLLLVLGGFVAHGGSLRIWLATAFIEKAPVVLVATAVAAAAAALRASARR